MTNSDTSTNIHYSLWNSAQEDLYMMAAKVQFNVEYEEITQDLEECGMFTGQNFIQDFLDIYRDLDAQIMEMTGLAYAGKRSNKITPAGDNPPGSDMKA